MDRPRRRPADGSQAGELTVADMTDDQWAAELHDINADLAGQAPSTGSLPGQHHEPDVRALILAGLTPLERLKVEGWDLDRRQEERLAAWEALCRFGMDVATIEARQLASGMSWFQFSYGACKWPCDCAIAAHRASTGETT